MNDIFREVFDSWETYLTDLGNYFQEKYNFESDDEDINAVKNTILGIAKDVPKLVSLALYCEDRTSLQKVKKVEKVKARGKTKTKEQISIVLNNKETAEKILHELHDFSYNYGGFDTCDIEHIVKNIAGDPEFHIETDYVLFTREEAYRVYLISRENENEYEIVFPPKDKAITLGCGKED